MMRMLKSGLTIGMLVAAVALTSGCGDNDNSGDNGNDNGGGPRRTATPVVQRTATPTVANSNPTPTATPGAGSTQTVSFGFTKTNDMQGFQIRVTYDPADGNFTGSAENVSCTATGGGGILTKNDNDTGQLTMSIANSSNLTFPITIDCAFEATSSITASDITVVVQEVTQNNAAGNIADLTVAVTVSDS